jgi:hypothetical protein
MTAAQQDYDWFKFDLQAGEKLTFDVDYGSGMSDDLDSFLDFFDEAGAIADNNAAASGSTGSAHAYTADGTPGYNDDNGKNAVTGAGSRDNTLGGGGSTGGSGFDTYIEKTAMTAGAYYVRMRAFNYSQVTNGVDGNLAPSGAKPATSPAGAGEGDYIINVTIKPTANSTGLGGGDIDGVVTGGGLALLDAWIYKNFETQDSINQARDALDAAEALVLNTEASFLHDRSTLESRASIFGSQIDGLEKEIRDLVEDVEDEARAELLARQLEYTIAQFDFTLLAARSNTLVQSILISQDAYGYGKSVQENTSRIGVTLNQSKSIWG